MEEELRIVDKFFKFREEKFLDEITGDMDSLQNNKISVKRQEINELIESISKENNTVKKKILESIDNIITDYDIAMAYYNKKYYRQGFQDAAFLNVEYKNK